MKSKCPVCQIGTLEDWNRKVRQCDSCGFQCDTADLPRIAAAMELARSEFELDRCDGKHEHQWQFHVEDSRRRVLKIFGGE